MQPKKWPVGWKGDNNTPFLSIDEIKANDIVKTNPTRADLEAWVQRKKPVGFNVIKYGVQAFLVTVIFGCVFGKTEDEFLRCYLYFMHDDEVSRNCAAFAFGEGTGSSRFSDSKLTMQYRNMVVPCW